MAQAVAAVIEVVRAIVLWPFLVVGLALNPESFDRAYYVTGAQPGSLRHRFPRMHFVLRGAWRLADPHAGLQQKQILIDRPDLLLRPPALNHMLRRDATSHLWPVAAPAPPTPPAMAAGHPAKAPSGGTAFDRLWPVIAADASEFSQQLSSITPTRSLQAALASRVVAAPAHSEKATALLALMRKFPEQVDHMLVLPWLGIRGGSEKVAERLIGYLQQRYSADRLCIFIPDASHRFSTWSDTAYGVPVISINEVLPDADQATRNWLFDRVMVNVRPRNVHSVNGLTAWQALRENGQHYHPDIRFYVSLYSDIRIEDGMPVGYYHNYLPYVIDYLTGVLCDNRAIMGLAAADFALTRQQAAKFHHVPTPLIGLAGGDPRRNLRAYRPGASAHSLWMSRIAREKRLDVVGMIAEKMPSRQFSMYGSILAAGNAEEDLKHLQHENIRYNGEFEALNALPLERFDSYVFTSNREGMPIAMLEAVMLGLPVVAPNVGGIGELIDDETGWLISTPDAVDEYVEALDQIRRDPAEAAKRVARAQERLVRWHSLDGFISALDAVDGYIDPQDQ